MRKSMCAKLVVFILLIISLFACSGDEVGFNGREMVEISFDEPSVKSMEELMEFATIVIRGEVLDSRVEWQDIMATREQWVQRYLAEGRTEDEIEELLYGIDWDEREAQREPELVTIYRIYVLEVFQGHYNAGDIIEVSRVGGELDDAHWMVDGSTELEIDSELVLFLWSLAWTGWDGYSLAHSYQAAYYVPSQGKDAEITEVEGFELDVELENVNGEVNEFVITLGDLVEIAEENDLIEPDETDD